MSEYLTMSEATARLKVTERTLRTYVKQGRLPAYKLGREYRFRAEDIDGLVVPNAEQQ
jgi:excisionase family DNA binding protein